jgi:hypothetical protein
MQTMNHSDQEISQELSKVFDSMSMMDIFGGEEFARYPELIKAVAKNLSEDTQRVFLVLSNDDSFSILPGRDDQVIRKYF